MFTMQISDVYSLIRANAQGLSTDALKADVALSGLLATPLGSLPKIQSVNRLLRELANRDVPISEVPRLLGLKQTPKGTEWYLGESGVLACIELWLDENKDKLKTNFEQRSNGSGVKTNNDSSANETTTQPNLADEAASAQAASIPTLLAATREDTVETLPPEPKIDGNIDHARKMLAKASLGVPKDDSQCWEAWCNERGNWQITGHTFYSNLQSDFFSTGAHVKNILTVKRGTDGPEVPMGPDDARGLFTDRRPEIDNLVNTSIDRLYLGKVNDTLRLINVFDESEREAVKQALEPKQELDEIGNNDFSMIDKHHNRMVQHWNSKCSTNYPPRDFLRAVDNIQSVCQDLTARSCDLGRFQDFINGINESRIIPSFSGGTIPTNEEHIGLLVTTYRELLQYQKDLPETFGLSHKRRVKEPLDRVYATHRGEGGLFALRFLTDGHDSNDFKILDFCGNGVLWTVAGHMSDAGLPISQNNIIDLERVNDSALFESNPNPNRFLVDLSNTTTPVKENGTALASEKYKAVVLNFVLNHFTDDLNAMKESVIAAREFLQAAPADTANVILNDSNVHNFPLFVVLLPESCQLERSPLDDILRSSGLVSYMQLEGENEVQDGRYQAIRNERGIDVASGVRSRVKKPYKIHIYALVDNRELNTMRLADKEAFELVKVNGNGTRGQGTNGEDEGLLKAARIQKNIAASNLRVLDLVLPSNASIPSSVIVNDPRYADFEANLATLIEYRQLLHPKDQARLDEIIQLWDWKFVPALSELNVNFVMNRPRQIKIPHGEIPNHLQAHLADGRSYSLVDLCREEDACRQSQTTNKKRVIEEHRQTRVFYKIQAVYESIMAKSGLEIHELLNRFVGQNEKQVVQVISTALKKYCFEAIIIVTNNPSIVNKQNYFMEKRVPVCPINASAQAGNDFMIIAPAFPFRSCDISSRLKLDTLINERVLAHQMNAGLTHEGFQFYLENHAKKQSLKVAPNFVQQLQSVQRKTISRETAELIAKTLQTSPEDILPTYSA